MAVAISLKSPFFLTRGGVWIWVNEGGCENGIDK